MPSAKFGNVVSPRNCGSARKKAQRLSCSASSTSPDERSTRRKTHLSRGSRIETTTRSARRSPSLSFSTCSESASSGFACIFCPPLEAFHASHPLARSPSRAAAGRTFAAASAHLIRVHSVSTVRRELSRFFRTPHFLFATRDRFPGAATTSAPGTIDLNDRARQWGGAKEVNLMKSLVIAGLSAQTVLLVIAASGCSSNIDAPGGGEDVASTSQPIATTPQDLCEFTVYSRQKTALQDRATSATGFVGSA